jgi:hypothetical protein
LTAHVAVNAGRPPPKRAPTCVDALAARRHRRSEPLLNALLPLANDAAQPHRIERDQSYGAGSKG